MKKKTTKEFKQEVFELVDDEYEFLGEYINNKTKILIRHNKCGYEYKVSPIHFLQGKRCPRCAAEERSYKLRKSTKQFEQEVLDLVGDEYTILGRYINSITKISIRHNICGNEYKVAPYKFLQNRRCPYCAVKIRASKLRKTHKQFVQEVLGLVGNEYTILNTYKNDKTEIKIRHNICRNEYLIKPNYFLNGRRCPKCSIKNKPQCQSKTINQFKQEVLDLVDDEYSVLREYENNKTKILMKHNICGNTFEMTPHHFLGGQRCPFCKRSKGEELISSLLDEWGYKYETQISFPDCKYKALLKFDFKVFLKDGSYILIEYNGIQHYKQVFGYQETFETQQIRDKIKENYCKKKGIKLYIIKYDDDIEKMLKEILKNIL